MTVANALCTLIISRARELWAEYIDPGPISNIITERPTGFNHYHGHFFPFTPKKRSKFVHLV